MIVRVDLRLARHGLFDGQDCDYVWGRADDRPLVPHGITQSILLGKRFLHDNIHFDEIHASSSQRGIETAEHVCTAMGISHELIIPNKNLRELHKGDWDGVHRDSIPQDVIDKINLDELDARPPHGETPREVGERILEEVSTLIRLCVQKRNSFFIVTHSMAIKCFVGNFLELSMKAIMKIQIHNASITHVRFVGDPASVIRDGLEPVTINDYAHLYNIERLRSLQGQSV